MSVGHETVKLLALFLRAGVAHINILS
jgi:hypothetical protein